MEQNNVFNFDENKSASDSTVVFDRICCETRASVKESLSGGGFFYDFTLPSRKRRVKDWRNKRNMMFDTSRYSLENYYTDVHQKRDMKHSFGDDLLNNLHLLPDPLKKNLADSIITSDDSKQKLNKTVLNTETIEDRKGKAEEPHRQPEQPPMAPFSGISSFFSGVLNVITGAVSQWRPRSPPKYYDCFDESNASRQGSPPCWHPSNAEDQNKNERAHSLISNIQTELKSDMNQDCRSAVAQCEEKLNKVRLLLSTKPVETPKYRSRRPRKVFVEPGSVEESFEDAFSPEDFVSLSNDPYIEYYSPHQYHQEELLQTDSPRMRTRVAPVQETTNIVETLPAVENNKNCTDVKTDIAYCEPVKTECKSENIDSSCKTVDNTKIEENVKLIKDSDNILNVDKPTSTAVLKETECTVVENVKEEIITSCEDKLSKLKALMQERRKKNSKSTQSANSAPELVDKTNDVAPKPSKTIPIEKSQDKRFKNPCRRTDKRTKTKLRKNIDDDIMFAHEIHSEDLSSSVENSPSTNSLDSHLADCQTKRIPIPNSGNLTDTPVSTPQCSVTPDLKGKEYFDEISGRFHSTSATDSEDSFQIVFKDSPTTRQRIPSDCDSEDSFIVFEDSPDSCYTTNDVFGDESEEDSDYTDSDSDLSDSGCVPIAKMAHNLSRTIGDLTDTSLYEESCVDEVDCAVSSVCKVIDSDDIVDVPEEVVDTGLLLTEAKKLLRKGQPPKKVQFSSRPPQVRVMRVWPHASKQARIGHWENYARDRDRFNRRIADVDMAVSWVLKPQHRSRVMFQRFMPWWNAQKRKEIAEKKQKKEEEELKLAQEKEAELLRIEAEKTVSEVTNDVNVDDVSKTDSTDDQDKATNGVNDSIDVGNKNLSEDISVNSKGDISDENKPQDSELKIVCNGVHNSVNESKIANAGNEIDSNDISTKSVDVKSGICKKVSKCVNKIKGQKCNNIRKSVDSKIETKMAVIQNGKIPSDGFKKDYCEDLNVTVKDIKLDLKKQISGT